MGGAMLERAIAALKANEAAALKAFNDEKNKDFRDRDLYGYCFSLPDGNITAYQNPVMIGTNVKELKFRRTIPLANAPMMRLQRPPKARLSALPTIFPSLASKRPRLRKHWKPESANRPAASVISTCRAVQEPPRVTRPPKLHFPLTAGLLTLRGYQ
jgi:hypothetical protein